MKNATESFHEIDREVLRIVEALTQTNADIVGSAELVSSIDDADERQERRMQLQVRARRQLAGLAKLGQIIRHNH